jgi:hypothetical protein
MDSLLWFFRFREGIGIRIIVLGTVFFVVSSLPLLLYIAIGPADGNPIGLGLLMVLGVVVLAVAGVVGLAVMLVETWASRPAR